MHETQHQASIRQTSKREESTHQRCVAVQRAASTRRGCVCCAATTHRRSQQVATGGEANAVDSFRVAAQRVQVPHAAAAVLLPHQLPQLAARVARAAGLSASGRRGAGAASKGAKAQRHAKALRRVRAARALISRSAPQVARWPVAGLKSSEYTGSCARRGGGAGSKQGRPVSHRRATRAAHLRQGDTAARCKGDAPCRATESAASAPA